MILGLHVLFYRIVALDMFCGRFFDTYSLGCVLWPILIHIALDVFCGRF